jgi:hypothetical protein
MPQPLPHSSTFVPTPQQTPAQPNAAVTAAAATTPVAAPPHIQLGTFDSFVSDLTWGDHLSVDADDEDAANQRLAPPPMAYYAVPTVPPPVVADSTTTATAPYPRRCFFTGQNVAKHGVYYAGCIVQGRRTLVVFCHVNALDGDDNNKDESNKINDNTNNDLDCRCIGTRLARRYPTLIAGLSIATAWQSYNTVCHWSGLPIHTDRDVHYRWQRGHVVFYLAEAVVAAVATTRSSTSTVVSSSVNPPQPQPMMTLAELQALPDCYEARVPTIVLVSLTYWELIDPTTAATMSAATAVAPTAAATTTVAVTSKRRATKTTKPVVVVGASNALLP